MLVTNTCIKSRFFPVSPPQMPMCLIVGCSRKCGGARGMILNNNRVCDQHFHSGTAAPLWDRHNIDWVLTLNLGHSKLVRRREQNEAQEGRAERSKRRKRQA